MTGIERVVRCSSGSTTRFTFTRTRSRLCGDIPTAGAGSRGPYLRGVRPWKRDGHCQFRTRSSVETGGKAAGNLLETERGRYGSADNPAPIPVLHDG
jgi:hypothetical protein